MPFIMLLIFIQAWFIVRIGVSTPPSKTPPPLFWQDPVKSATCPSPNSRQFQPIYWFFVTSPYKKKLLKRNYLPKFIFSLPCIWGIRRWNSPKQHENLNFWRKILKEIKKGHCVRVPRAISVWNKPWIFFHYLAFG